MIKMTWIEPLKLETFFVNVFAGDGTYFGIIALIAIISMAAYFRMAALTMFFMIAVFLLMFNDYIALSSMTILAALVGGLLVGYWIRRLMQ